jgi:hypothetical protein
VLAHCAAAGLATVGVIAIDGTKVAGNANRDRTMGYEQIARAIVDEAIETDVAETAAPRRSPRRLASRDRGDRSGTSRRPAERVASSGKEERRRRQMALVAIA